MLKSFDLTGKVAIVTGGAGGIGYALSTGLAQAGADVVVTSRTVEKLKPVAEQIKAMGKKALAVPSDVSDEKSVQAMVDRVMNEFGHIDILVNAAGINIRNTAEGFPIADFKKVMDFNVTGTFLCSQVVASKAMIQQKSGKIINLSSVRGRFAPPAGGAAYAPSKGAVDSLTRTLAIEWAKYNIFVNAIAPTVVHTELTQAVIDNKALAASVLSRIPLNRFGEPEDMIGPVVFLASDASNFVTGQILYVDGGASSA